jgi:hypothetical protein
MIKYKNKRIYRYKTFSWESNWSAPLAFISTCDLSIFSIFNSKTNSWIANDDTSYCWSNSFYFSKRIL